MNRILFIVSVLLAVALTISVRHSVGLRSDRRRLEANQEMLLQERREYVVRDSLSAVSVGMLTMSTDELRRGFERMSALVRDMDVKLRRVENLSQASIESRYEIAALLRDTLIGTAPDTSGRAQALRFSDAHIELDGLIVDSVFYGSVLTRDTLTQIVHRVPRRFLFLRWGTKELRQEIVSSNPHTRITYSRSIRIVKL